ncbi:uncharacterized protein [Panulirus ornatus]|uniref:uncharacterized protein n=1 Tax=Panulirus ornatus TaxID=150431 RepID=UPI003A8AEB7E
MSGKSKNIRFQCEVCKKVFTRKHNLILHTNAHFATKIYKCNVCKRSFKSDEKLIKHMEKHSKERPHECKICKKRYASKISMEQHMELHENEVLLKCNICHIKCTSMSALVAHKKEHGDDELHQCEICYNIFSKADNHQCHETYPKDYQVYKCRSCYRQFTDLIECLKHMKGHTDENLPMCQICGQRFLHILSLKSHMRLHNRRKRYKCKVCGEQFAIFTVFVSHKRSHIKGEKCFDCVLCSKKFVKKYELRSHMLQHVDEKPLKCNVCKKHFSRKDALRRHMRHLHLEVKGGVLKFKPYHRRRTTCRPNRFKRKVKTEPVHENITIKKECNEETQGLFVGCLKTRSKTNNAKKKLAAVYNETMTSPGLNMTELINDDEVCEYDFEGFNQVIPSALANLNIKACVSDSDAYSDVSVKWDNMSDFQNEEGESSNNHHLASSCENSGSSWYENEVIGNPVTLNQSKCTVCGKFFTSEIVRTYHHMRQHMGEECNQCMYCGQVFYNCSDFRSHQILSHSVEV